MFQRFLPVLLVVAHAGLWIASALTLGKIDGPIPDHFDLSGQPDHWSNASWWLLPVIALAMTAFFVGVVFLARRLAQRSPEWVNLPRKREWLALTPEARLRVMKPVEALVIGFALFMNLTFVSLALDTYAVASGAATGISTAKLVTVLVCMVVWLVLSIIRIRQAISEETRAARQASAAVH